MLERLPFRLEFNPFSVASRAGQAERRGELAKALALYDRAGQRGELLACLKRTLPQGTIRELLVEIAEHLYDLERCNTRVRPRSAGQADALVSSLAANAQESARIVWGSVERIAAAYGLGGRSPKGSLRFARQEEQLQDLLKRIREATHEVAQFTADGEAQGDAKRAEEAFRAVTLSAQELREMQNGNEHSN
jgi:hypothetical protein